MLEEHKCLLEADSISIYNPDIHTIISFNHKKINSLIGIIADKKALRKRMKHDFKKAFPCIENMEDYNMKIANKARYGFKYQYVADNILYNGVIILIIEKGHSYNINFSCRNEYIKAGSDAFKKTLDTITM